MCCTNKKHTLIECIFSAVVLYVFHHFLSTKIYRFHPRFVDFNESGVAYSSYCSQHLLIDFGPKLAAMFAIEIGKPIRSHMCTIPIYQLTVFRTRFLYSVAKVFMVLKKLSLRGRQIHWNEFDLTALSIFPYRVCLEVPSVTTLVIVVKGRR